MNAPGSYTAILHTHSLPNPGLNPQLLWSKVHGGEVTGWLSTVVPSLHYLQEDQNILVRAYINFHEAQHTWPPERSLGRHEQEGGPKVELALSALLCRECFLTILKFPQLQNYLAHMQSHEVMHVRCIL